MGLVTPTTIAEIFGSGIAESLRLTGIVEDEDARYLGAVGLMKRQPVFRGILGFPWNGILSDDSRFLVRPMVKSSEGRDGVALIFRQFDSSKYQDSPEELFAGWVPVEQAAQLDAWVTDMNQQLAALLPLKRR